MLTRLRDNGQPVPALEALPSVWPHLQHFMEAYNVLSKRRAWTAAGPAAIPLVEIEAFVRLYRLTRYEADELLWFLDELDNVYLAHAYEKRG